MIHCTKIGVAFEYIERMPLECWLARTQFFQGIGHQILAEGEQAHARDHAVIGHGEGGKLEAAERLGSCRRSDQQGRLGLRLPPR